MSVKKTIRIRCTHIRIIKQHLYKDFDTSVCNKAIKSAIENYPKMKQRITELEAEKRSLLNEIDRLKQLCFTILSANLSEKIRYSRSIVDQPNRSKK